MYTRPNLGSRYGAISGIIPQPEKKLEAIAAGLRELRDYHLQEYIAKGVPIRPEDLRCLELLVEDIIGEKGFNLLKPGEDRQDAQDELTVLMQTAANAKESYAARIMAAETVGDILRIASDSRAYYGHETATFLLEKFSIGVRTYLMDHYKNTALEAGGPQLPKGSQKSLPPR